MGRADTWDGERIRKLIRPLERKLSALESAVSLLQQSMTTSGGGENLWGQIIGWEQNNSTPHFIPLAGIIERPTPIADLVGIRAPMPRAATVLNISIRPQGSPGSTTLDLYVNGSSASSDTQTLNAGTNTTFTFDQSLSAGDDLAVLYTPTSIGNDMTGVILFRWD